jgi:AraC-like DNA-binding protein
MTSSRSQMRYREFSPRPALASVVECLWTLEGHASELDALSQPVLPDGRPELVLHFGDKFQRVHHDGHIDDQPMALFAGQLTSQLVLRPTGRISVLGVRFHPFGAAALLGIPQFELSGETLDLCSVSASLGRAMRNVRENATSLSDAAATLQVSLLRLVGATAVDDRVRQVASAILQRHGQVSIDALAGSTGWTRRHLERQFQQHVGLSPKRLARIARFQRALYLLNSSEAPPLDAAERRRGAIAGAQTAAECGYADQSHFIRDFKDLAGCAPTEHLVTRGVITGFFLSS